MKENSFIENLGKHIIPNLCIGCGSCIITCPFNCLILESGKPKLINECKECGLCSKVCPKYNFSSTDFEKIVFNLENSKKGKFGVYKDLFIAKTKNEEIMEYCQDGGIVTSILQYALKKGIIDSVVLSSFDVKKPLISIPKLVITENEILENSGTRYTYSPNTLVLNEAVLKKKEKIAFVGTPCQIQAIRMIQRANIKNLKNKIIFTLGLLCSKCYTENLPRNIKEVCPEINLSQIKKVNIKGNLIIKTVKDEEIKIPLKKISASVRNCHNYCFDFSAELADISVGGLGLTGWTLCIIRSKMGNDIFNQLINENKIQARRLGTEDKKILILLNKLSEKKKLVLEKANNLD